MPIVGLTDGSAVGDGLPLIAKLYKGGAKPTDGRKPGADLDYFRVEFEPQFENCRSIWTELYGERPTEFAPIHLVATSANEAFVNWQEEWDGSGGLVHRCDGQAQAAWRGQDGQTQRGQKACAAPSCRCKPVGRLKFLLPEFVDAAGVLGYVSVSTHSVNDILTVYRYLADIEKLYGTLRGIPFVFGRAPKEVSAPKQVKTANGYAVEGRIKTQKSLFYIHADAIFTQTHLLPALAGGVSTATPALPASVSVAIAVDEDGVIDDPAPAPVSMSKQLDSDLPEGNVEWGDILRQWVANNPETAVRDWTAFKGLLYNAAMELIYGGNVNRMKTSVANAEANGVITSGMTIAQALVALHQRTIAA